MVKRSPSLDTAAIEKELQELAGSARVAVKVDPRGRSAVHLIETDSPDGELSYTVILTPSRLRARGQLDRHLDFVRAQLRLP